jgi:hypothetical protein
MSTWNITTDVVLEREQAILDQLATQAAACVHRACTDPSEAAAILDMLGITS